MPNAYSLSRGIKFRFCQFTLKNRLNPRRLGPVNTTGRVVIVVCVQRLPGYRQEVAIVVTKKKWVAEERAYGECLLLDGFSE
jgi:hypothetical protein